MHTTIGAFDAKAHLSLLLQKVKRGKRYTITLRGVPVADLIPSESMVRTDPQVAIEAMRGMTKVRSVSPETLMQWIAEGRK